MLAIDIIRNLQARGFTVSLTDEDKVRVTPASQLPDDDRKLIKAYKTELLWRLRHPDGDPDPFVTTEACPVCGAELLSGEGKRFRKAWCPAGHVSGWRPPSNQPLIDENGDLVIPLDAEAKYRWWQGGQSVADTLRELREADR